MTLRHVGYRAIRAARRCAVLSWRGKLVMVMLADHAGQGGTCFPSEPLLAKEAGVTERTIRKAIAELEKAGVLEVQRRRAHLANVYRIDIDVLEALPVLDKAREERRAALNESREERGSALPDPRAERGARQSGTSRPPERNDVPPNGSRNGIENGNHSDGGSFVERNGHSPSPEAERFIECWRAAFAQRRKGARPHVTAPQWKAAEGWVAAIPDEPRRLALLEAGVRGGGPAFMRRGKIAPTPRALLLCLPTLLEMFDDKGEER